MIMERFLIPSFGQRGTPERERRLVWDALGDVGKRMNKENPERSSDRNKVKPEEEGALQMDLADFIERQVREGKLVGWDLCDPKDKQDLIEAAAKTYIGKLIPSTANFFRTTERIQKILVGAGKAREIDINGKTIYDLPFGQEGFSPLIETGRVIGSGSFRGRSGKVLEHTRVRDDFTIVLPNVPNPVSIRELHTLVNNDGNEWRAPDILRLKSILLASARDNSQVSALRKGPKYERYHQMAIETRRVCNELSEVLRMREASAETPEDKARAYADRQSMVHSAARATLPLFTGNVLEEVGTKMGIDKNGQPVIREDPVAAARMRAEEEAKKPFTGPYTARRDNLKTIKEKSDRVRYALSPTAGAEAAARHGPQYEYISRGTLASGEPIQDYINRTAKERGEKPVQNGGMDVPPIYGYQNVGPTLRREYAKQNQQKKEKNQSGLRDRPGEGWKEYVDYFATKHGWRWPFTKEDARVDQLVRNRNVDRIFRELKELESGTLKDNADLAKLWTAFKERTELRISDKDFDQYYSDLKWLYDQTKIVERRAINEEFEKQSGMKPRLFAIDYLEAGNGRFKSLFVKDKYGKKVELPFNFVPRMDGKYEQPNNIGMPFRDVDKARHVLGEAGIHMDVETWFTGWKANTEVRGVIFFFGRPVTFWIGDDEYNITKPEEKKEEKKDAKKDEECDTEKPGKKKGKKVDEDECEKDEKEKKKKEAEQQRKDEEEIKKKEDEEKRKKVEEEKKLKEEERKKREEEGRSSITFRQLVQRHFGIPEDQLRNVMKNEMGRDFTAKQLSYFTVTYDDPAHWLIEIIGTEETSWRRATELQNTIGVTLVPFNREMMDQLLSLLYLSRSIHASEIVKVLKESHANIGFSFENRSALQIEEDRSSIEIVSSIVSRQYPDFSRLSDQKKKEIVLQQWRELKKLQEDSFKHSEELDSANKPKPIDVLVIADGADLGTRLKAPVQASTCDVLNSHDSQKTNIGSSRILYTNEQDDFAALIKEYKAAEEESYKNGRHLVTYINVHGLNVGMSFPMKSGTSLITIEELMRHVDSKRSSLFITSCYSGSHVLPFLERDLRTAPYKNIYTQVSTTVNSLDPSESIELKIKEAYGMGLDGKMKADINKDGIVTLGELRYWLDTHVLLSDPLATDKKGNRVVEDRDRKDSKEKLT